MMLDPWGVSEHTGPGPSDARPRGGGRWFVRSWRGLLASVLIVAMGTACWFWYGRDWLAAREALSEARSQRAGALAAGGQVRAAHLIEIAQKQFSSGEQSLENWRFRQARESLGRAARAYALAGQVAVAKREWDRIRQEADLAQDAELSALLARFDQSYQAMLAGSESNLSSAGKFLEESAGLLEQAKARVMAIDAQLGARREWQALQVILRAANQSRVFACFPEQWKQLVSRLPREEAALKGKAGDLARLGREAAALRDRTIGASLEAQHAKKDMEGARMAASRGVDDKRRAELAEMELKARQSFEQGAFADARDQWRKLASTWRTEEASVTCAAAMRRAEDARTAAADAGAQTRAREQWNSAARLLSQAQELRDRSEPAGAATEAEKARKAFVLAGEAAREARLRESRTEQGGGR